VAGRVAKEGAPVFKELVEFVAKALVDQPDQVHVEVVEDPAATTLKLRVAPGDLGRVIGKQGRTARAIRTLLHATAAKAKRRVVLEIVE
jgi:predicted RNA-binding protein YlqC (UPF0109 family)